jgi:hypothetical protein
MIYQRRNSNITSSWVFCVSGIPLDPNHRLTVEVMRRFTDLPLVRLRPFEAWRLALQSAPGLMKNHSNVVVHVLFDVSQEGRCNHADDAKHFEALVLTVHVGINLPMLT